MVHGTWYGYVVHGTWYGVRVRGTGTWYRHMDCMVQAPFAQSHVFIYIFF